MHTQAQTPRFSDSMVPLLPTTPTSTDTVPETVTEVQGKNCST